MRVPFTLRLPSSLANRLRALAEAEGVSLNDYVLRAVSDADVVAEDRAERMEEALLRIAQWAEAYPLAAFPEPDADYFRRAHEVLVANGMSLDRISASNMRHVIQQVGKIAREALA